MATILIGGAFIYLMVSALLGWLGMEVRAWKRRRRARQEARDSH